MRPVVSRIVLIFVSDRLAIFADNPGIDPVPLVTMHIFIVGFLVEWIVLSWIVLLPTEHGGSVSFCSAVPLELNLFKQAVSNNVIPAFLICSAWNLCSSLLTPCLSLWYHWLCQLVLWILPQLLTILLINWGSDDSRGDNHGSCGILAGFSLASIAVQTRFGLIPINAHLLKDLVGRSGFLLIVAVGHLLLSNYWAVQISLALFIYRV